MLNQQLKRALAFYRKHRSQNKMSGDLSGRSKAVGFSPLYRAGDLKRATRKDSKKNFKDNLMSAARHSAADVADMKAPVQILIDCWRSQVQSAK